MSDGVKPDKTPTPKAAQNEMEIAPLNETDTITALLPMSSKLKADTNEAALHDNKASKVPYIGVWAVDDAACGKVDQSGSAGFAVITMKSIRQDGYTCQINAVPPEDNPTSIEADCTTEGARSKKVFSLLTTAIGGLQVIADAGANPVEYVRCELPK